MKFCEAFSHKRLCFRSKGAGGVWERGTHRRHPLAEPHTTGIPGCGSPGFSPSETFFLHKDQKFIALSEWVVMRLVSSAGLWMYFCLYTAAVPNSFVLTSCARACLLTVGFVLFLSTSLLRFLSTFGLQGKNKLVLKVSSLFLVLICLGCVF